MRLPIIHQAVEREHARAAREEAELEERLKSLLREQAETDEALAALARERMELDAQATDIAAAHNAAMLSAQEAADEALTAEQLLAHCKQELRRLKATSVLDDVFDIWFDGPFGTINGLRLGRLPSVQVDWAEVNAALGHATLLLDTLASAHHLRFPRHTLHPMGSFSKVAHVDDPKNLFELHGTGSLHLGRIFSGARFDRAMVMFLQCVAALIAHAKRTAVPNLSEPPYRIDEDRIGKGDSMLSIRLQFNQDEVWTRALKYMLTDLKWLLAWHTQHQLLQTGGARPPPA
mmetsp:Transcript_8240/g.24263  ORF Transcript_8240/g.24263 Transcript_8240/m.24263 type:complete len:290 (+) Transcript_8240:88-957(+)